MKFYTPSDVREGLPWPVLVEALRNAFAEGCEQPGRLHLEVGTEAAPGDLLVMPAWRRGEHVGCKLVTVFPKNADIGLPAVAAAYMLFDGRTGALLAHIEGSELTARRTAATSVLAAGFLARGESRSLTVVGTGRMGRMLAEAYSATFPIETVTVWGRSQEKARAAAESLAGRVPRVEAETDIAAAVARADIVTTATLSKTPIVRGSDLRPGTHLDLVGGFRPDMRETDDEAIARAEVFVDTFAGSLEEAGDIVQPLRSGALARERIAAELSMLCRREHPGRRDDDQITIFKSVGAALEDLAAAVALEKAMTSRGLAPGVGETITTTGGYQT